MSRIGNVVCFSIILTMTAGALASPLVNIPNFAVDPSGPDYFITPVGGPGSLNDDGMINALPAVLEFGVTSVPDGTPEGLIMEWEGETPGDEAQAGWELVYGVDPDIHNETITLSVNPPGGWSGPVGSSFYAGVISMSVVAVDISGVVAGGWGFNTDMAGLFPLANDPTAAGLQSLPTNVMSNVVINVGNGPAAGSALVTPVSTPGPTLIAPNFLVPGNGNFGNIGSLQFFENGILQGGMTVIPGQTRPGLLNYWDHVTVTPEPGTLSLLLLGGLAMLRRRK